MVSFLVTPEEHTTINTIVTRALEIGKKSGVTRDRLSLEMDITACHANGCPLRLGDLAKASDANLAHDVFQIERFIDRNTGKLEGFFLPRYAV